MNISQHVHKEQPLTAIGKTRLLALLLMDIYGSKVKFKDYVEFIHDREFYAQVADGQTFPIPKNSSSRFLRILMLKNPVQLRRLRALLRLPNSIWDWADDLGWTENFIRQELFAESKNELELITLATNHAFAGRYFENSPTNNQLYLYQHLLLAQTPSEVEYLLSNRRGLKRVLLETEKAIRMMDNENKQMTIDWIRNLISEIEAK